MWRKRKIRKRIHSDGDLIESQFVLFVNNVEPMYFQSRSDLDNYLTVFRSQNSIFKLQIFRIDTYSL